MMKVLALAELCNPEWPSLPVVGYQYAKALAEVVDLTVVTQIRNKPNIEAAGLGKAKVEYIDTEWIAKPMYRMAKWIRGGDQVGWTRQMAMDYLPYITFERQARNRFRSALDSGAFDVVHRLTPMSPTHPSPMASWTDTPFVLGPLNGNLAWPKAFLSERQRERDGLSRLRTVSKLLPYSRSTFRRAKAILAGFEHTISFLPENVRAKTINFPEVGVLPSLFSRPDRPRRAQMTILYAGRLVPYKLPDAVVRAFAQSPVLRRHKLRILGDGPEREGIEAMIAEHGLSNCVEMAGKVSQGEVAKAMRESEIFAFPSIRELGAGVVVEAMACGMAVVGVDYGAPGTLLDGDHGVTVPAGDKDSIVRSFRTALERLVENPELVRTMGDKAHEHALAHYSWDAKAQKTVEIYEWVLGRRSLKPDFWAEPAATVSPETMPVLQSAARR